MTSYSNNDKALKFISSVVLAIRAVSANNADTCKDSQKITYKLFEDLRLPALDFLNEGINEVLKVAPSAPIMMEIYTTSPPPTYSSLFPQDPLNDHNPSAPPVELLLLQAPNDDQNPSAPPREEDVLPPEYTSLHPTLPSSDEDLLPHQFSFVSRLLHPDSENVSIPCEKQDASH